jgi:hypothetical protein
MTQIPMYLYNCNSLAINIAFNGGPKIAFNATSADLGWAPMSPVAYPNWAPSPAINALGPGQNWLVATPEGVNTPYQFDVTLPISVNWVSLQMFFFWNGADKVSWLALNAGQVVSGDYNTPHWSNSDCGHGRNL